MHPSAIMSSINMNDEVVTKIRHIPLSYSNAESQTSALRLVLTLFPEWEYDEGKVEFIRFTDGITNTVRIPTILEAYSNTTKVLER